MYGNISSGSKRFSGTKFEDYQVSEALYCLTSFERAKADAEAIKSNKALMAAVRKLAARRLAEKRAEDDALKSLAGEK